MKTLSVIISVAALAIIPHADASSSTEQKGERVCRIIFPERPNDAPKSAFLFDGKESRRVDLPSMNFSKVITLPPGKLTLVLTQKKIEDPKNFPDNAPKLKVEPNVSDFYILLTARHSNSFSSIKMSAIDISNNQLEPGETYWINKSEHKIFGKLGENDFSINPNSHTVSRDPTPETGYYRAELSYQSAAEGKLHQIIKQNWWHDANKKHLGFIVDTGGRLPKVFYYRDFR